MDRAKIVACLSAAAGGVRQAGGDRGGLEEFHRAGAAGRDSGAADRAAAGRAGGAQAEPGRHAAGARGAGQGAIDLYPEYTGTALTAVLKDGLRHRRRRGAGGSAGGISEAMEAGVACAAGFQQHVRHDGAARGERAADACPTRRRAAPGVWASGYEFEQRRDGLDGLRKAYGLRLAGDRRSPWIWACFMRRSTAGKWT